MRKAKTQVNDVICCKVVYIEFKIAVFNFLLQQLQQPVFLTKNGVDKKCIEFQYYLFFNEVVRSLSKNGAFFVQSTFNCSTFWSYAIFILKIGVPGILKKAKKSLKLRVELPPSLMEWLSACCTEDKSKYLFFLVAL